MQMIRAWPYQQHKDDRTLFYIALVVIVMHLVLVISSMFLEGEPLPKVVKERLVVKTINLKQERIAPAPMVKPIAIETVPSKPIVVEPTLAAPPPQEVEIKKVEAEEPVPTPTTPAPEPISIEKTKLTAPKPEVKPPQPKKAVEKPKAKTTPQSKPKPKAPSAKKAETSKKLPTKSSSTAKTANKSTFAKKESGAGSTTAAKKPAPAVPKPDPVAEAAKEKRRQLLANVQKSINKVDRSGTFNSTSAASKAISTAMPATIDVLQVEALPIFGEEQLTPLEVSYYEELAHRLKLLLRLPEYGEVVVKLTLDRAGKFMNVVSVGSKSEANKSYIEKALPTLKYPSFNKNFQGLDQYTFVLSLSNDL